ncbi:ArsR/SmtB family transcription factor [Sphingorhabdus arenilitoris]|uniref:ArsR/SmtB family transcription factor n=1 Tax=Sphingorhabdus arenilitoris TaxID=1490041 RepID=A0ABV8RFF1_9SPHN
MSALYLERQKAETAAAKLKHFAQPQRLMILSYLLGGERNVSDIDEATSIGQPALSQQLAALRKAELVKTRREGTQIYYSPTDADVEGCIRCIELMASNGQALNGLLVKDSAFPNSQKDSSSGRPGVAGFARILD